MRAAIRKRINQAMPAKRPVRTNPQHRITAPKSAREAVIAAAARVGNLRTLVASLEAKKAELLEAEAELDKLLPNMNNGDLPWEAK